jgi:hypothetical protein
MNFAFEADTGERGGSDQNGALHAPVHFSSGAIFSSRATMEACPIPFSAILNPFAILNTKPPLLQHRSVHICSNSDCQAYCSPYCEVSGTVTSGVEWCCSFCGVWTKSDFSETESNLFTPSNPIKNDRTSYRPPELSATVVDSILPAQLNTGQTSPITAFRAPACVFVVDLNIEREDMQANICKAVEKVLSDMPKESYVGLVTFGAAVSVYEVCLTKTNRAEPRGVTAVREGVKTGECIVSNTFNGDQFPMEELFGRILAHEQGQVENSNSAYMFPLHACRQDLVRIIASLPGATKRPGRKLRKSMNGKRQRRSSRKKISRKPLCSVADSRAKTCRRCTGSGISLALQLLRASHENSGSVIVLTNGPMNSGPQTREELKAIGAAAFDQGVAVHFMCVGAVEFNTSQMLVPANESGGSVVLHREFSNLSLGENIAHAVLRKGRVDVAKFYRSASSHLLPNAQSISVQNASVTVRCFNGIALQHVIGPSLLPVEVGESDLAVSTLHKFRLRTADHSSGITFFFTLSERDLPARQAYIQFTVSFTESNSNGSQIHTRVITHRVLTTSSKGTYLKSIDVDVASVAMGKRAILIAEKNKDEKHYGAKSAANDLCNRIYNTMVFFSKEISASANSKNEKHIAFPHELNKIPRHIFHLLRGPCLGPVLQHADDISCIRTLFLESDFFTCRNLMSPPLLCLSKGELLKSKTRDRNQGSSAGLCLRQVPLETLALQSNWILYLDHFSDVFIWSGIDMKGAEYDTVRKELLKTAKKQAHDSCRYPAPNILSFCEGESMARWLEARLVPSHKDSEFQQMQSFPQLGELGTPQLSELREKLLWTDDYSFFEWMGHVVNGTVGK